MRKQPLLSAFWRPAVLAATLAGATTIAVAQTAPPSGSKPGDDKPVAEKPGTEKPAAVDLEGTVASLNFGPAGDPQGVLLTTDKGVVQVNMPPHLGIALAKAAKPGDRLTAKARPAPMSPPDHPVYELTSLTANGTTLTAPTPGERPPMAHVEGTVASLNYTRDGRVDGAVLSDGTFVHVGPDAAAKLGLKAGLKVAVDGESRPTMSGSTVLAARTVNGTDVPRPAPRPGPRGDRPAPPPRPGDAPPPPPGDAPPAK